jgi:hypothetical protein
LGGTPQTAIPTFDDAGDAPKLVEFVSVPPVWPAEPPSPPFHPEPFSADLLPDLDLVRQLPTTWGKAGLAWWMDLKRLHDWSIPPECRVSTRWPEEAWRPSCRNACSTIRRAANSAPSPTLRRCWRCDPPRMSINDPLLPPAHSSMTHLPLDLIPDGDDIERAYLGYITEMIALTDEKLRRRHGIEDLYEIVDEIRPAPAGPAARLRERLRRARKHEVIELQPEMTLAEILAAARFHMSQTRARPELKGRVEREPLTCVQAAIWRDEFDLPYKEIAGRLEWPLLAKSSTEAVKERVRDHIAAGRKLLSGQE